MSKLIQFFKAHPILKHIVYIILVTILLIVIVAIYLNSYTNHNDRLSVPDVCGLRVESAAKLLEGKGLLYEVIDSVYSKDVPKGFIVEQTPAVGSIVKQERKIYLVVNSHSDRAIPLPNVVDLSVRQATSIIEASGLRVEKVTYKPSDFKDLVLGVYYRGQELHEGIMLLDGSAVELYVGDGNGESDSVTTAIDSLVYREIIEGEVL